MADETQSPPRIPRLRLPSRTLDGRDIANQLRIFNSNAKPRRKWMMFVDGENYTIRVQKIAASHSVTLDDYRYIKDVFFWTLDVERAMFATLEDHDLNLHRLPSRSFFYTSITGDDDALLRTRLTLRDGGFTPVVFKKVRREYKAKGVDIALTRDLLVNAFQNLYDFAVLIAADGDYVPVVEEVQRMGKHVIVAFPDGDWVSDELRWRADHFVDATPWLQHRWKRDAQKKLSSVQDS